MFQATRRHRCKQLGLPSPPAHRWSRELNEKTTRHGIQTIHIPGTHCPEEFKLMFSHKPRSRFPGWAGKLGTSLTFQLAFQQSFEFKAIQWNCMIYESISWMLIQLTHSSWKRKRILEITIEIECELGSGKLNLNPHTPLPLAVWASPSEDDDSGV